MNVQGPSLPFNRIALAIGFVYAVSELAMRGVQNKGPRRVGLMACLKDQMKPKLEPEAISYHKPNMAHESQTFVRVIQSLRCGYVWGLSCECSTWSFEVSPKLSQNQTRLFSGILFFTVLASELLLYFH